jgi:hypothetical protein
MEPPLSAEITVSLICVGPDFGWLYIGVSRETIGRTLNYFKNHQFVEQRGSTMYVSNLQGLGAYAGPGS